MVNAPVLVQNHAPHRAKLGGGGQDMGKCKRLGGGFAAKCGRRFHIFVMVNLVRGALRVNLPNSPVEHCAIRLRIVR